MKKRKTEFWIYILKFWNGVLKTFLKVDYKKMKLQVNNHGS